MDRNSRVNHAQAWAVLGCMTSREEGHLGGEVTSWVGRSMCHR